MQNPFEEISQRLGRIEDFLTGLNQTHVSQSDQKDIGGISVAIEETGLSSHSIYRLVSERKLPHSKRGGRLYFSRKILRRWIEEGQRSNSNSK